MARFGIQQNGESTLPQKEAEDGKLIPDADVPEVHKDDQKVLQQQIEHGVYAEELGYDQVTFTEHHFQAQGFECSPNPLMSQMAVAAQTDEIDLMQTANIIAWHDPVRLAEQVGLLDVYSGGRVQVGIGRGYQTRESETLGQYWGGTLQDQEVNRQSFDEKWQIMKKAWTKDLMSHHGQYHDVPKKTTKWHHKQDKRWFDDDVTSYDTEEVMDWKEGDVYQDTLWSPVIGGGTTLKKLYVSPQPLQEPYPQPWMPINSPRSVKWAARNGVNGVIIVAHEESMADIVELYMATAEEAGWPDRRPEYDGEPFKYGYDEKRNRGVSVSRYGFNTEVATDEEIEALKKSIDYQWDYFGPFGFASAIAGPDEELGVEFDVDLDEMIKRNVIAYGDTDEIVDSVLTTLETVGVEDLCLNWYINSPGLSGETEKTQMKAMAERVNPRLEEEYPSPP